MRLSREAKTVELMIELYCHDHHGSSRGLCEDCCGLWGYVRERLRHCPLIADKPTCVNCPIHCYKASMRERIRAVMRYSGPRMALRHPILSVLHLLDGKKAPASREPKGIP
jgi:hypothetical protein